MAEDLRKAAERILATEHLEDVTIRRLTREVGVVPANFYNHFASLDELLLSIVAKAFEEATDRAIATWSRPGAKADLLVAAAVDFIAFCLRNRQLMRLMLRRRGQARHDGVHAASTRSFSQIAHFIYDHSPEPGPAAAQCRDYGVAFGYVALCYGFALVLTEGRFDLDTDDEAELSLFVRNGILPFMDGSAAAALSRGGSGRGPAARARKPRPAPGE